MIVARGEITIAGQPAAVFPDGTEIIVTITGPGVKRFLDAFSNQLAHIGLTPIQWEATEKLERTDEQQD